jgi:serine/threonine protein kinase
LLHIPSTEEDLVVKEVKAIKRLCGPGAHVNIVQVLNHGHLSNAPFYFIDMEFCNLNLHDYIHRKSHESSELRPYFIRETDSISAGQIWVIMSQITAGVEYIHQKGHIHRDIKPANGVTLYSNADILVLYSSKDDLWKLAEFGLTVEGSSRTNHPTQYARGTPGYRAPELMESDDEPKYTNKVDVWSMGCILYELTIGARAFPTDYAVLSYLFSRKNKVVVLEDTFDAHSIETITKHIFDMLQIESSGRPSASILLKEFTRECQLTQVNHPITQHLNSSSTSITVIELSDDTEQTRSTPQNHQVIVTKGDNSKPIFPSHLIGVSLYSVAEKGDVEAVKILLAFGADVNVKDQNNGRTPMSYAAGNGHSDVVKLLLQAGAEVDLPDEDGRTPMSYAAKNGHSHLVTSLLQTGAKVDAKDLRQRTPISHAAWNGHSDVVKLLLQAGAEVNFVEWYKLLIVYLSNDRANLSLYDVYGSAPSLCP